MYFFRELQLGWADLLEALFFPLFSLNSYWSWPPLGFVLSLYFLYTATQADLLEVLFFQFIFFIQLLKLTFFRLCSFTLFSLYSYLSWPPRGFVFSLYFLYTATQADILQVLFFHFIFFIQLLKLPSFRLCSFTLFSLYSYSSWHSSGFVLSLYFLYTATQADIL